MMTAVLAALGATVALAQSAPAAETTITPFDEQPQPPAPDYALASAWAARPGAEGMAALVPAGATPIAKMTAVDVFYVYPTTFRSKTQWNADVADGETNHWTDISVIARQASVFNGCCRIFAPRYRQASLAAFAAPADGAKAYALAYTDVLRAFERYLANDNHGRPFILAGHSQGALMVRRLLTERIKATPVARRLVVAYILGIGIAEGDFAVTFAGTPPCKTGNDTGCVLSWNSFLASSDTESYRARSTAAYRAEHGDAGSLIECVNPLALGGARQRALGALPGAARDGPLQPLVPGAVQARCQDGVLMATVAPALELAPLPGGNMHYHDMSLYYADIRADAARRARAFVVRGNAR